MGPFSMGQAATTPPERLDANAVAVVWCLGSFCPFTLAHLQCFEEAKKMLLLKGYREVRGLVTCNADRYVEAKLAAKGPEHRQGFLSSAERRHLIELSCASLSWIRYSDEAPEMEVQR